VWPVTATIIRQGEPNLTVSQWKASQRVEAKDGQYQNKQIITKELIFNIVFFIKYFIFLQIKI
jgi:hypothetical protein